MHKSKKTANFRKYMGMKKLRKAALAHIASNLTKAEVGSLGQLFGEIDLNKDDMICLEELEKAVEGGKAKFFNSEDSLTFYNYLTYLFLSFINIRKFFRHLLG